jgi:hypothetical protein
MSRKLRTSFVGRPNAILFLRISREGVFQQPHAFTLIELDARKSGQLKTPRLICESGRFNLSFLFKPISLPLSPSPTERVVLPQSFYGRWQTLFVS